MNNHSSVFEIAIVGSIFIEEIHNERISIHALIVAFVEKSCSVEIEILGESTMLNLITESSSLNKILRFQVVNASVKVHAEAPSILR